MKTTFGTKAVTSSLPDRPNLHRIECGYIKSFDRLLHYVFLYLPFLPLLLDLLPMKLVENEFIFNNDHQASVEMTRGPRDILQQRTFCCRVATSGDSRQLLIYFCVHRVHIDYF